MNEWLSFLNGFIVISLIFLRGIYISKGVGIIEQTAAPEFKFPMDVPFIDLVPEKYALIRSYRLPRKGQLA